MGCEPTEQQENDVSVQREQQDVGYDRALGAIVGAFCGDAAGGPLEFQQNPSPEAVERGLSMQGKGRWGLGPGQITDDSELALALAKGLAESKATLDLNIIVKWYGKWMASPPFGKTIAMQCRYRRYHQECSHGHCSDTALSRESNPQIAPSQCQFSEQWLPHANHSIGCLGA